MAANKINQKDIYAACETEAAALSPLNTVTRQTKSHSTLLLPLCLLLALLLLQVPSASDAAPAHAAHHNDASAELETLERAKDALMLLHELARYAQVEEDPDAYANWQRVHKRHNAAKEVLEWQNACSGSSDTSNDVLLADSYHIKMYLKSVRKSARMEFKAVKLDLKQIDVDNIREWRQHERRYNFLPTLERNATIAPKCWQRGMQTFIASFAYLHRQQEQFDMRKMNGKSDVSMELQQLLTSARRVQCEIETAIRGVFPPKQRHIETISRAQMNGMMKFYTKGNDHVDQTDLRMAKFFYQNFLLRMWKIMPRKMNDVQLSYDCSAAKKVFLLDKSLDSESAIMNSESYSSDDIDDY